MTSTRRRTAVPAGATALALGTALMLPSGSATAATPSPTPPSPAHTSTAPAPSSATVTLVTGDVVHLGTGAAQTVTVDRAPGATGAVHVQQSGGHTYVVPDEARSLLAAGTLDRRLFDVTALVGMGYDDAHSAGVPLIATWTKAARAARSLPAAPSGARTVRALPSIGGAALSADKKHARAFWDDLDPAAARGAAAATSVRTLDASNGIARLWLDAKAGAALQDSVPQINAPQAWAEGYDGTGEKVAVLDTGVDDTHPDLQGRVAQEQSFVPGQAVADGNGHGTHVASTIAGSGADSGGLEKGVAPGARLLVGKVLSNEGEGQDSWIIAGMEWAKAQGADVVSMSLGSPVPDDGTDPMAQAVNSLSADGGPLFVIAAGNAYGAGTIGAPGSARSALTVAAVDSTDQRADFSSMGPLSGSYGLKPDLSAPGVDITAAKPGGGYQTMSGTSMATPHIAGAAAILRQRHPDWPADRLKDALMSSSKVLADYTPFEQGTGRVDVLAAVDSTVQATGSVDTAVFRWPNAGAAPVTRTVTYRNSGTAPVALNLSAGSTEAAGAAYTLSADTVTIPAGGSTDVTLTLDPAAVPVDTTFSGQVTATDAATGAVVAHTGFGLVKEKELYDYTIKLLGRDGKPAAGTVVVAEEGDPNSLQVPVDGQATLRLERGTYMAYAEIDVPGDAPDSLGLALLADPETVLGKDTTVTLDASKAHRISASVPQRTQVRQLNWDLARTFSNGQLVRDVAMLPLTYDALYASPTRKVTDGSFRFLTRWRLGEPTIALTDRGRALDTTTPGGSPVGNGSSVLATAYAGQGAAADYAGLDVRGKAVVVDRGDAVPPAERAANAKAAGAALLVVVNDGRGRLLDYYAGDDGSDAPLPVVTMQHDAGTRLAAEARSGTRIQVAQRTYTRYVYDLLDEHDGTIPDRSLAYTPDPKRDLATVNAVYNGDRTRAGGGYRYDIPAWGAPGVGFAEKEQYPSTRTEYVSRIPGSGYWYEEHSVYDAGYQDQLLEERGSQDTFLPGRSYGTSWFGGVFRPRLGTAFWGPTRSSYNDIQFNITPWTDGAAGHSGSMPADEYDGRTTYAAYRDGTLIAHGAGRAGGLWDQPATTLPYRLVIDSARDAAQWKTSVRTHTAWDFVSGPVTGDALVPVKLLQLDYTVATDTADDVPAGRWTTIGLSSATQEWLDSVTRATSATLSVSYDDGAHWQPVTLDARGKGSWSARIRTPHTPGGAVSLKATASDGHGGSVSQEIIRAFGLK